MADDNFLEKFKGQIQTMGKDGIFGTINSNEKTDKKEILIYNNNIQSHKIHNLKPIKKGKSFLKPIEKPTFQEIDNNNLKEQKIQNNNIQNEINQNNQINYNPYMNNPQFFIPNNPYIPQFNYPIYQMNNYNQPYIINPYQQMQLLNNQNIINNNNLNNTNNTTQNIQNDLSNISKINTTINSNKTNGKAKLRPISANQSHINNISNISSGRLNSAYSKSRISTIEYKPYTLKDYKELEKAGVILGSLGPNIGTKEWEEKKKKMQKMEEYSRKIASMKKRTKSKEKFENVIEEEKKKKIENSIRRRCYEYGNLIRPHPRSANIFGRRKNNNKNNNLNHNNNHIPNIINNKNKFELDCSNKNNNNVNNDGNIEENNYNDDYNYNIDKPIFSMRKMNNAYVNHDNIKRYDVNNFQNKFKNYENEEKQNEKNEKENNNYYNNMNNIMLNKNDFLGNAITNDFYQNEENDNYNIGNDNETNYEKPEINSDNIEKLLEARQQYLKNIDMIKDFINK